MKRIHEYTDVEILEISLDEAKVSTIIDLECAYRGIPLLPTNPGEQPTSKSYPKDAPYYDVVGVKVKTPEAAARILEAITKEDLVATTYHDGEYVLVPSTRDDYHYPSISPSSCFLPETYDKLKDSIVKTKQELAAWDKLQSTYDNALKERATVSKDFYHRLDVIKQTATDFQELKLSYVRYLQLADNNTIIARNFLLDSLKSQEKYTYDEENLIYIDEDGNKTIIEL